MKTEELKGLGLNDEQIKAVMSANGKDVNTVKEQLNQVTADRDGLKTQLETATGQLTTLQSAHKDDAALQKEIDQLKQDNTEAATKHQQELRDAKVSYLTDLALTKAGAKNTTAVKALLKADDLKLDDNGKLIGLDEQLKGLKESDDSSFMFDNAKQPNTPPISPKGNPNPNGGQESTVANALGLMPTK